MVGELGTTSVTSWLELFVDNVPFWSVMNGSHWKLNWLWANNVYVIPCWLPNKHWVSGSSKVLQSGRTPSRVMLILSQGPAQMSSLSDTQSARETWRSWLSVSHDPYRYRHMNGLMAATHCGLGERRGRTTNNRLAMDSALSWSTLDGTYTLSVCCPEKHSCHSRSSSEQIVPW